MKLISRFVARSMSMILACALLAASASIAQAKPLTPETVHTRIVKRGLGNWVGVELVNGTAFTGRIVSIDEGSFGLQLHNDPAITPVLYRDVVELHTGISHGGFWAIAVGVGGVVAMSAIGIHELHKNEQQMPTLPGQPVFP